MDHHIHRNWMYNRLQPKRKDYTSEFMVGINEFITFATNQSQYLEDNTLRCPCAKHENRAFLRPDQVRLDLLKYGFKPNYWYWTAHGKCPPDDHNIHVGGSSSTGPVNLDDGLDRYENLVYDALGPNSFGDVGLTDNYQMGQNIEEPPNVEAQRFYDIFHAAYRPLWSGCKSDYNLSEGCFNRMAKLIKSSNPTDNHVPNNFYDAKKLVNKLGLSSVKIDCCVEGCMLYYKNDANMTECKFCGHPRFKPPQRGARKLVPYKRMHYMPLIPRLKRLYASLKSAEPMRWHSEHKSAPGVVHHPSDALAWKHFNEVYPDFAADSRNVRLGLCADGFNPFNHTSNQYSCWPVIVTPYNLLPELCMTSPYMFLTCLIPDPRNPKSRIDVYMQPLIDELNILWSEGVETYDISKKQNFRMRAALMWTINDFPAYGMLSRWMTSGKLACPICIDRTKAFRLKYGGKVSWFDCHRQFLPNEHPFRNNKDSFYKGRREKSKPLSRLSGQQLWEEVCRLPRITDIGVHHGKIPGYGVSHNWTKCSIFWDLPYWKDNLVRHNLDVMHIEKNFFDNVLNTVMDINDKTKDNVKARIDLNEYCQRPELHLKNLPNGKFEKPKESFTLSDGEISDLCAWLEHLKMPDGYASNLARCADHTRRRLHGLKSHDCHVFMQRLCWDLCKCTQSYK